VASAECVIKGVGYNFDGLMKFDPTPDRCIERFLWPKDLLPHNQEQASFVKRVEADLNAAVLMTPLPVIIHETNSSNTESRTTQSQHVDVLTASSNLKSFLKSNNMATDPGIRGRARQARLGDLHVGAGLVTGTSMPDAYMFYRLYSHDNVPQDVVFGIWETKNDIKAPKEALSQAQGECSNVAFSLHNDENLMKLQKATRLPEHHIPIPSVVGNGRLLQFCATIILPLTMPCSVAISDVLDLNRESDRALAAKHFLAIKEYAALLQGAGIFPREALAGQMALDAVSLIAVENQRSEDAKTCLYVCKPAERVFCVKKDNFFHSLRIMFQIFGKLYDNVEARSHVTFPYCYRSSYTATPTVAVLASASATASAAAADLFPMPPAPLTRSIKRQRMHSSLGNSASGTKVDPEVAKTNILSGAIVFDNLKRDPHPYRSGLPLDVARIEPWLAAAELALQKIAAAGVIHVDMYLSNIMWREQGSVFHIKLIDWDAAHFMGSALTPDTLVALKKDPTYAAVTKLGGNPDVACVEYHLVLPVVIRNLISQSPAMNIHPDLFSDSRSKLNQAYRLAVQDYVANVN